MANNKITKKVGVVRNESKVKSVVVPTQAAERKSAKPRAVSFETVKKGNIRTFRPVNKRAKVFALLAGKDTLQVKDLKAIRTLKFRVVETGSLEAIAL